MFAVRAESHAAVRLLEGEQLLAGLPIPHFHRLIERRAGQAFAVGTVSHARDTTRVPLENPEFLAGLGIPLLQRVVYSAANQPFAIRAESHAGECANLPVAGKELLAFLCIP